MRNLNLLSSPKLSSLLFCSALGGWAFPGCSAKINGYVPMGGDTGGSAAGLGGGGAFQQHDSGTFSAGGTGAIQQSDSGTAGMGLVLDSSKLSNGDNNALSTGGYWWTYVDHNGPGSQYHASISQLTSLVVGLQPVVDSDPSHGNVLRVSGMVPGALPWADVSTQVPYTIDAYWSSIYPDSMIWDYPAAGIGFGFKHLNAPFDATGGGKWVGIAFDMKSNVDMQAVWVSMPMVGTDLPDPNFSDNFPKQCQYYSSTNPPATGGQSCFTHYREGIFSGGSSAGTPTAYNTLASVGTWHRYCVLFSDVAIPQWANATTLSMLPPFDPTKLLKVQWDMYEPNTSSSSANYDISLDNVSLVSAAQAQNATNNCNAARIGQPPGTGNAG